MITMDSIEKNKMIKIKIKNQKMPKVINQKTIWVKKAINFSKAAKVWVKFILY